MSMKSARAFGFVVLFSVPLTPHFLHAEESGAQLEQLYSLSLSELMAVKVRNVGSLTTTSLRKTPAASTRITDEQIRETGARSLQELLEIYVPGVQWIRHHWEFSHLGSRGVISDREDKVMIRVNGRVMNERTHAGAVTERNFPMMGDIHYIDVIRGPGSSLYGLGAVSMVIDIHTHSAKSGEGKSLSLKAGGGHVFQSLEGQFGEYLNDGTGVWFYLGMANIEGADDNDAPWVLGVDACTRSPASPALTDCVPPRVFVPHGETFPIGVNDGLQYDDRAPIKAHLQINRVNTDFWIRYTRAGETEPAEMYFAAGPTVGFGHFPVSKTEHGYEQFTVFLEHRRQLKDKLKLTGVLSFDSTELVRRRLANELEDENHREQEWFGRVLANWKVSNYSDVVLGAEYSHERFGLDGDERAEAYTARLGLTEPWSTSSSSLLGEWQWSGSDQITTFVGGRLDKNSYSDTLFSPRASLVWTPDKATAWKFIASRSQRMNFAEENRAEALAGENHSLPETLDSLEVRYEHVEDNLQWALSTFYLDLDAIGWDSAIKRSVLVGEQRQWGVEFEWKKRFGKSSLAVSHAYTDLLDFDPAGQQSSIAVAPYKHLNNWSNHITKVQADYQLNDELRLNASLRAYWDFPGLQDYYDSQMHDPLGSRFITPGWDKGSQEQLFLNMGANWKMNDKSRLGLHFYNLLGLVDEDYNKRTYLNSLSDYRAEAPAAVLSLSSEF